MNSIYSSKPWVTQYKTPAELPVPDWSMIDAFERTVCQSPDAPAIYYFDETISFAALDDQAGRFPALLAEWGIGKGDRVAASLQNDPPFPTGVLCGSKAGRVHRPPNPVLKCIEVT